MFLFIQILLLLAWVVPDVIYLTSPAFSHSVDEAQILRVNTPREAECEGVVLDYIHQSFP